MPLEQNQTFATAFARGLLDPTRPAPPDVAGRDGRSAGRRYDVYRNNVTVSLIEALAAIYPAVQRITGPDFFRAMARCHIRKSPPTSPLLFDYGRDFPAFIESYEHARELPWLADVARIERGWLDAYHARDAAPLSPAQLAAIAPERLADLVLIPHPATGIVRSKFSAVTIFAANRDTTPVERIDGSTPEDALITRAEFDVVVRHLPPGGAVFAASLMSGRPLGEAAASALNASPDFDLASNIAGLIEAGAFTSIAFGDAG
ncbi:MULTISPECIES: DNA-binding domain-containing protein [unclassified Bradyrhizobium]|uniref:HvfC/BufC N-terminal domain-containing protein n=1 Tax=unclassified Bradyrhizobium TaxID=2631580 RepID=UPI001FF987A8|nr:MULTISPECIES: DNA-binding domain-containing protein [unclassified Bradyrhizobium]MCK1710296.1 putative DNA-binding domain-containing protein [Bradyrhizobium sp. 143]MCK1725344.1 putative DNA-binding domain-containing protein [Bradyrhizobium sp. 142]